MDAGLAAVIAAAAGAGGAALAAFGTSFATLRQTKMERDSAHRLWLRNHQQQAFEELLLAVRRLKDLLPGPTTGASLPRRTDGSADLVPYFEEYEIRSAAVAAAVTRVSLLADLDTGSSAFILGTAMSILGRAALRDIAAGNGGATTAAPTEEALTQLWEAAHSASTDFALKAQQTLQKN
ncbi:hypothetical protein ABZ565_33525 [Streptomyces sp. NPDC016469]|uniref:hypothetical protein n=1 Tax=Streptomyces sp. NPDC016469 TaxID=3157191 RepID=UPI003401A39F